MRFGFTFKKSKKIFKKTKIIQKRNFYLEEISQKLNYIKIRLYFIYM